MERAGLGESLYVGVEGREESGGRLGSGLGSLDAVPPTRSSGIGTAVERGASGRQVEMQG